LESKKLALTIANAALNKQALSVEIINVGPKVDYADYVVICSGNSPRQVDAIINGVEADLKKEKIYPLSIEGQKNSQWVLMDYGDVIFHVFEEQNRLFYDLENLWIDATRVPVKQTASDMR
jgi:ribosome-associated protein